ncbi:MAG: hypothetical protein KGZ87_01585 [Bacteroidetes bacterium]|nr:hypothetical protein [Bacteroidota bacterium]
METQKSKMALTDASLLITEACVKAGADAFIGYPITPSNKFYSYGSLRFPLFLAGPDEITVLQWMSGLSAAGKLPVTSTAFPGLALMAETFNMAYMMELPMLVIVTQRLGPSTGSATTGAQGDLSFINGLISGGFPIPVFCPSNFEDAWTLAEESIKTSVNLRTPVILLTSKEMVMTQKSFDLTKLHDIKPVDRTPKNIKLPYKTYFADETLVPPFIPVANNKHLVRLNSSTHDDEGMIQKNSPNALANTKRLKDKIENSIDKYLFYELDNESTNEHLIVTYGISAGACRDAVKELRKNNVKVSLLVVKTILPVAPKIISIIESYNNIYFVEENIGGQYKEIIFGKQHKSNVYQVNKMGHMINPDDVIKAFNL